MRWTIASLILCVPFLAHGAAQTPDGRWEGVARIPGKEIHLVMDLAQDTAGTWAGSIIIPGLGIKGAPLSNVAVVDANVSFDIGTVLNSPTHEPARFKARVIAADAMTGEMSQGGNIAQFSLKRSGPPQVERSQQSTAVRREVEGEWRGEFELGGYPRQVTVRFENHQNAAATATFVIIGKRTTTLPVELVIDEGNFVRIESQVNRVTFEGRLIDGPDALQGTIDLGPVELPLVLRRSTQKAS
jgi:hypothetical protein